MLHIKIITQFDITNTKVTRKNVPVLPVTLNGREIKTPDEWHKSRRQQSNWESLVQVLSLRTQPLNIRTYQWGTSWVMEFDVEFDGIFTNGEDDLYLLKTDCNLIPLITGLDEVENTGPVINNENTTFEFIKTN